MSGVGDDNGGGDGDNNGGGGGDGDIDGDSDGHGDVDGRYSFPFYFPFNPAFWRAGGGQLSSPHPPPPSAPDF